MKMNFLSVLLKLVKRCEIQEIYVKPKKSILVVIKFLSTSAFISKLLFSLFISVLAIVVVVLIGIMLVQILAASAFWWF